MKEIKLTQGRFALVDDEDYEYLNQWRWYYSDSGYAVRKPSSVRFFMHRVVINTPEGMFTDHINRNKLDNRRENLRICTRSQNCANVGILPSNTSGYKGVSFDSREGKWRANIRVKGKKHSLGYFENIIEAVSAYNIAALEHFGEFAVLNQSDKLVSF